jgi:hypothetical protein
VSGIFLCRPKFEATSDQDICYDAQLDVLDGRHIDVWHKLHEVLSHYCSQKLPGVGIHEWLGFFTLDVKT